MKSISKSLIIEVLLEALWGRSFQIVTREKNGMIRRYIGMATANAKPGERPYRITWFSGQTPVGHVDMTWEEINETLASKQFSPEIIKRAQEMWGPEAIALSYVIQPYPGVLTEGISISVEGPDYSEQIESMLDLSFWLGKKVLGPLMKQMSDEKKKIILNST